MHTRSAAPRGRKLVLALVLAVPVCLLAAGSSSAAPNVTWTGSAPFFEPKWSDGANWGGDAPSGTVGTLTFPTLTSLACAPKLPIGTCYTSENDVSGLKVGAISIDDGASYHLSGNALTLGGGGISASTSSRESLQAPPTIANPIILGAPQTWSIDGNSNNAQLALQGNITGQTDALAISLTHQTFLGLYGDVEVGPVTVTGGNGLSGSIALGSRGSPAKLNASDGNPISFKKGAGLFAPNAATGPLTFSGGILQVGELSSGGTLSVGGAVRLDSASTFTTFINKAGTSAGTDYAQLSASKTVNLGGANLTLYGEAFPERDGTAHCPTLGKGQVDTLIKTSGSLTGTFAKVPDGGVVSVQCSPGTEPTVRINYTEQAVTATVLTAGGTAANAQTATTLATEPASPATNQAVTLTATVAANTGMPSGTVSFQNQGVPIPGCENQPLSPAPYTATCQTTFAAGSPPGALTAVFTPKLGSGLEGSTSLTKVLTVTKDASATVLGVSSATPVAGANVTYTATITPGHAGSLEPSGSVEFLDAGVQIGACTSQPLTPGASSSSASCMLSYATAGKHSVTVAYAGDANFTASTSLGQEVSVQVATPGGGSGGGSSGGGGSSDEASGGVLGIHIASGGSAIPSLGKRETVAITSGTATIRPKGTSTFVGLSGSTSIPDGSEVDATNGRILVTAATANGGAVSAGVYGGRFRLHQDASGTTRFTLTLPLAGCQAAALPRGSAAREKHKRRSRPTSRHLWVSETGGKWGTNGRYVSTSVEGTTWLTLDECTRSAVTVTAGKVLVRDLLRRRTKTLTPGKSYIAGRSSKVRPH